MPGMGEMSGGTTSDFIGMAFFSLMAFKIAGRRNWARWLLAIVVLLSVAGVLFMLATMPRFAQLIGRFPAMVLGLNATQSILQIAALVLVFTRESSLWFKGPSDRTDGSIIRDAG
jgi:NADH:ubiquinone oxidoreductase subunit K